MGIGYSNGGPAMRQSKFDKIAAPLGRDLGRTAKKVGRIASQAGGREAVEENADLNLEAAELLQQLRKFSDAVPHLRLVSDTE
jgi:regulator of replication initiation timing